MRFGTFTGPSGEYGMAMDTIFPADNYIPGQGNWSLNATLPDPRIYTQPGSSPDPYNLLTGRQDPTTAQQFSLPAPTTGGGR